MNKFLQLKNEFARLNEDQTIIVPIDREHGLQLNKQQAIPPLEQLVQKYMQEGVMLQSPTITPVNDVYVNVDYGDVTFYGILRKI